MSWVTSMTESLKHKVLDHPKVAFIHVPKCGGVSVVEGVFRALYPSYLKGTPLVSHIDLKASKRAENLLSIDMMLARQISLVSFMHRKHSIFVTGHCYAAPQVVSDFADWHFISVLRNPVDRFISEYIYNTFKASDWNTNNESFTRYLDSDKAVRSGNGYCRYFSGYSMEEIVSLPSQTVIDAAVTNVSRFTLLGQLEDMNAFKLAFQQRFKRPLNVPHSNTSPNNTLAQEIKYNHVYRARIEQLCERDTAVYNAVFSQHRQNIDAAAI